MNTTEERMIELAVIESLLITAKYYNLSLKQCGLYKLPNRKNQVILDKYPTVAASITVLNAYRVVRKNWTAELS